MAQPRQHPALKHQYAVLDLGLGPMRAGRQHRHAVMLSKVVVVAGGLPAHSARPSTRRCAGCQAHTARGAAAEEGQRAHMATYPVRQLLAPGCFDVRVVRRAQHGHEHLGAADFAGSAVGHADGLAGIVDEQALDRRVGLPHRCRQLLAPAPLVLAERAVQVAVRLLGLVLLPQQFQRHAFAAYLQ